ncbi:MAG: mobile mystery protein B [Gammaproteobacteria bacterium]|nr:mobile mystery protein B [Gammaproteobacteria bacterium]
MKFEYAQGATPLDPDEVDGLIPFHITTQGQLNEWEAANILEAESWLFSTANPGNFLTIEFTRLLHKKMLSKTWEWAGTFRKTSRNIGVDPNKITMDLKNLLDDLIYQIININNGFTIDEIAYRFHHRLVSIHPFPNGNGRHARLMTDYLLARAGSPKFTWGKESLIGEGPTRTKYIEALRQADKHDYSKLAAFVRS